MSIEERLARLKKVHKKVERPPSGNGRQQPSRASGMAMMKHQMPLDPVTFQEELAKRTADE